MGDAKAVFLGGTVAHGGQCIEGIADGEGADAEGGGV